MIDTSSNKFDPAVLRDTMALNDIPDENQEKDKINLS